MKGLTACGGEIGLELKTEPFLGSDLPSQRFGWADRREGSWGEPRGEEGGEAELTEGGRRAGRGWVGRGPGSPGEWVSGWLRKPAKKAE